MLLQMTTWEYLHHILSDSPGGVRLSLIDFGAGVGQYRYGLLALSPSQRYISFDGAGNIVKITNGFVSWFDLTIPLNLPRADWLLC